ncbi:MAG: hypothetical protein V2J02_08345 [Pseudomonadales bacterium]|nr:hypothetical protein [Pseudomonadales bacterium]
MNRFASIEDALDGGRDAKRLATLMIVPDDDDLRDQLEAVPLLDALIHGLHPEATPDDLRAALAVAADMASFDELRRAAVRRVKDGIVAGDLLAVMYVLWRYEHVSGPSKQLAFSVYGRWAKGRCFGDGTPIPRSATSLRKKFEAFLGVASLWAAYRLNQSLVPLHDPARVLKDPKGIASLLAVAVHLEHFMLEVPSHGGQRWKSEATIWRVPPAFPGDPEHPPPFTGTPSELLRMARAVRNKNLS